MYKSVLEKIISIIEESNKSNDEKRDVIIDDFSIKICADKIAQFNNLLSIEQLLYKVLYKTNPLEYNNELYNYAKMNNIKELAIILEHTQDIFNSFKQSNFGRINELTLLGNYIISKKDTELFLALLDKNNIDVKIDNNSIEQKNRITAALKKRIDGEGLQLPKDIHSSTNDNNNDFSKSKDNDITYNESKISKSKYLLALIPAMSGQLNRELLYSYYLGMQPDDFNELLNELINYKLIRDVDIQYIREKQKEAVSIPSVEELGIMLSTRTINPYSIELFKGYLSNDDYNMLLNTLRDRRIIDEELFQKLCSSTRIEK